MSFDLNLFHPLFLHHSVRVECCNAGMGLIVTRFSLECQFVLGQRLDHRPLFHNAATGSPLLIISFLRVFKTGKPVDIGQINFPDGAVSLFANDDFGDAPPPAQTVSFVGALAFVINLVPVDE